MSQRLTFPIPHIMALIISSFSFLSPHFDLMCVHPTSLGVPDAPRMLPHIYIPQSRTSACGGGTQDFGLRWWDFISKTYCGNLAPWGLFPLLASLTYINWAFYRGCSVGLLPSLALTLFPFSIRWTHFLPSLSEFILTYGQDFVNPFFLKS